MNILHVLEAIRRSTATRLLVGLSRLISIGFILRGPVIVVLAFCVVILWPSQIPEYLMAFAQGAQLTKATHAKDPILFSLYAFSFLIAAYSYELIAAHMDANPNTFLHRRPVLIFIFVLALAFAPAKCLHAASERVVSILQDHSSITPNSEGGAASIELALFLRHEVNVHLPHIFSFIFLFVLLRAGMSHPDLVRVNRFYHARRSLFFAFLPGVAIGIWIGTIAQLASEPGTISSVGGLYYLIQFFTLWLVLFCVFVRSADKVPVPVCTIFVALWGVVNFFELNRHYDVITASQPPPLMHRDALASPMLITQPSPSIASWLKARIDETKSDSSKLDVFVVAAQGGGLYAAYHAALLTKLLHAAHPAIGRRTFGTSAVSGGAVGVAIVDSLLSHAQASLEKNGGQSDLLSCTQNRKLWEGIERQLDELFAKDYLSEVVTQGLYVDSLIELGALQFVQNLAHRFSVRMPLVSGDRATALERAFVREVSRRVGVDELALPLTGAMSKSWSPSSGRPAMFFNVTASETGNRLYIGPLLLSTGVLSQSDPATLERAWLHDELSRAGLTVVQAAILSARFPIVTPPGIIRWNEEKALRERRIVDGGYFDNSGISTALSIVDNIRSTLTLMDRELARNALTTGNISPPSSMPSNRVNIKLLVATSPGEMAAGNFEFREFGAPLQAMLQAISSRANESLDEAYRILGRERVIEFHVSDVGRVPALGWVLTRQALLGIRDKTVSEWTRNKSRVMEHVGGCE